MEFKTANREWVKNAAIIFLAVLLVLTFFSNTIMNRSLVEVATARVTDGNIVAKVRGTGTVTASGKHQVKATKTRTVRSVMVKAGQEVQTGDVLFILGEGDGDELEQAEQTLRDLQTSYQKAAISMPTFNYSTQQLAIDKAQAAYEEAKKNTDELNKKVAALDSNPLVKAAKNRYEDADKKVAALENDYNNKRQPLADAAEIALVNYNTAEENRAEAQNILDALVSQGVAEDAQEYKDALAKLEKAKEKSSEAYSEFEKKQTELDNFTSNNGKIVDEQRARRDALYSEYTRLIGSYAEDLEKAIDAEDAAYYEVISAENALYAAQEADEKTLAAAQIDLANLADQIARQQEKIKSLAGEDDNTITANVNGKIDTIDCTAGDTVTKDSLMCTIEVPDMGHTVSFSVTNDQAQRLRTGDTATVSNYYWGNTITATLTNIRTDPKNPQTNKLLTFDLEGDVTTGSELTLSVGQKSANYDTIVPNSAIRSDNNGSFVLAISQKSSPLGNRYIAKRVSIEVLASDDNNSAVVADLGNGDYVITTGSGPIKNGDQVRMADSSEG